VPIVTRLDAVTWRSATLAGFHALRAELDDRFGLPSLIELDSNGVGSFDAYLVRCECGLEVAPWRFYLAFDFRRIDDEREPAWVSTPASPTPTTLPSTLASRLSGCIASSTARHPDT
jgi:hypothetical protein